MKDDPGLWPSILVFSPPLSYLAWTNQLQGLLLSLSAAFVLVGLCIFASGKPARWKSRAPNMLLSGLIQFVLIVPMTGFMANQKVDQLAGANTSIAGSLFNSELPTSNRPW